MWHAATNFWSFIEAQNWTQVSTKNVRAMIVHDVSYELASNRHFKLAFFFSYVLKKIIKFLNFIKGTKHNTGQYQKSSKVLLDTERCSKCYI